jgi:hypothetical protein
MYCLCLEDSIDMVILCLRKIMRWFDHYSQWYCCFVFSSETVSFLNSLFSCFKRYSSSIKLYGAFEEAFASWLRKARFYYIRLFILGPW